MRRDEQTTDLIRRKERLLTQATPSRAAGIADAVVIKDGDLFFLCRSDGCVPGHGDHGLGLYYHDCRFLSRYDLRLAGAPPESLAASSIDGFRSIFQLTNPELVHAGSTVGRQQIGVRWRHVIDAPARALRDEFVIQNYDTRAHSLPLSLTFDADFADVFTIRGLSDAHPGVRRPVRWAGEGLVLSYHGGDGHLRELVVHFSEAPSRRRGNQVEFDLRLSPQATKRIVVSCTIQESRTGRRRSDARSAERQVADAEDAFDRSMGEWMGGFTRVRSSSLWLDKVTDRSLRDLRALQMTVDGSRFFAAGVPWFTTLFGRDSILVALQTLAYHPESAAETARLLAKLQGKQIDPWRDEQPGKILHELRVGELARMGEIPHTPYYGTVDATPLFLILIGQYTRWTGDLLLFDELREPVEAGLRWMAEHGDTDGDGYIDYRSEAREGLINQGWKDSGDAIVTADGEIAEPPIALVEVQGYVYLAKVTVAQLFQRRGEAERAEQLRREADDLRARFNRDYWLDRRGFLALALHRGARQPLEVISSNPGHAVWTGIVAQERVPAIVKRLMAEDMYSGWGIRTLSSDERAYNPVGYHLGTVWPHDNALIAAGFRRHGFDAEACRIFSDLLHAATYFEHHRLPEAFAGFARDEYGVPVRYPVACHPQAWAAGSVPFMLQVLLGLEPDAFEERLRIVRPCLPAFIQWVQLERLHVGGAEVDLLFERGADGGLTVRVERKTGKLDVVVCNEV